MMKKLIIVMIAIFMTFMSSAQDSDGIIVKGKDAPKADTNHNLYTINEFHNNTYTVIQKKQAIVDINSNLTIHLNKEEITARLAEKLNHNSSANKQLQTLSQVLANEIEILKLLSIKINTADPANQLQQLGIYTNLMAQFYNKALEIPELRAEVNRLTEEYFQKKPNFSSLNKELYPNPESYLVRNLSVFNKKVLNDLQTGTLSKAQLMLRAYIQAKNGERRKVHIVNFDNYALGEYYEVPRWVTSFSAEDKAAYQQVSKFVSDANDIIAADTKKFKELLSNELESINAIKILGDSLMKLEDNKEILFPNAITPATDYLEEIKSAVAQIHHQIYEFASLPDGADANVLEHYNESINAYVNLFETFNRNTQKSALQLPEDLKNNSQIKKLQVEVNNCITAFKNDVQKVKTMKLVIKGMLQPFASANQSVKEVIGETFKKAIAELPDEAYIDLKTNGKRLNGEMLEITLSYQIKTDSNKITEEIQFDQTQLIMQLIDFYSVSSISVVLAHPFNNSNAVTLDRNYQFAPAASLLLKFGSRKSNTWNSLSPGLGVVLATPDMDLDGSPDFSFGAISSLFRDVLSFGISYNTRTDSPFTHIGLCLPFNAFGGVQNTVATK